MMGTQSESSGNYYPWWHKNGRNSKPKERPSIARTLEGRTNVGSAKDEIAAIGWRGRIRGGAIDTKNTTTARPKGSENCKRGEVLSLQS